jgi:hypothetical protein
VDHAYPNLDIATLSFEGSGILGGCPNNGCREGGEEAAQGLDIPLAQQDNASRRLMGMVDLDTISTSCLNEHRKSQVK